VKKSRQEAISMVNLDADDPVDDSDSDSGDSDDDTAMLMAELQKIKAEKAMEEAEKVCIFALKTTCNYIFLFQEYQVFTYFFVSFLQSVTSMLLSRTLF
jgi:hypothetical protein